MEAPSRASLEIRHARRHHRVRVTTMNRWMQRGWPLPLATEHTNAHVKWRLAARLDGFGEFCDELVWRSNEIEMNKQTKIWQTCQTRQHQRRALTSLKPAWHQKSRYHQNKRQLKLNLEAYINMYVCRNLFICTEKLGSQTGNHNIEAGFHRYNFFECRRKINRQATFEC